MNPPPFTRRLQRLLLTGFFIVAPLSLTFLLVVWFVASVDRALAPVIGLIGRPLPGLGLITALTLVLGAGILASNLAGRHLIELAEEWLLKIPVFNWIYKTIKQVSDVFAPSGGARFQSVVIVEYPRPGVYSMGFVTNRFVLERGAAIQELLAVYIPTNHMYVGDTILVPPASVIHTDLPQQQGIQAAMSAGAAFPARIRSVNPPDAAKKFRGLPPGEGPGDLGPAASPGGPAQAA